MTELIVPMDVCVLCVSKTSGDEQKVRQFAGMTLNFKKLPYKCSDKSLDYKVPCISSTDTILRTIETEPYHHLKPGTHLHWSLPRTLTKGHANPNGEIDLQALPNRWLITRVVTSTSKRPKTWVVESDYLHQQAAEQTGNLRAINVAVNHDKPYRFMGRAVALNDWTGTAPPESLHGLTGSNLHAFQTGDPIFAAFYPNCMHVFGFHDDLSGVPDTATLMYLVTGWYGDATLDPLYGGLTKETIEQRYGWIFDSGSPTATLFNGMVQNVGWHGTSDYFSSGDDIAADIAVGNNVPEALAAWICGDAGAGSERDTLEHLVSAFQLGYFNQLAAGDVDQLPTLMDGLQRTEFGVAGGGTVWTIVRQGQEDDDAVTLPDDVAQALNVLNTAQKTYDTTVREAASLCRQLYSDWFRYGIAEIVGNENDPKPGDIAKFLKAELGKVFEPEGNQPSGYLTKRLVDAQTALNTAETALETKLDGTLWQLKALAAPRYYQAHDPVVMLSGTEVAHRLAGIGADDPLACRTSDQLITKITVSSVQVKDSDYSLSLSSSLPYRNTCKKLVSDACLVNKDLLAQKGAQISKADLTHLFTTGSTDTTSITALTGKPPIALAAQWWSANPWHPVVLAWEADIHPLQNIAAADSYTTTVVSGSFELDDSLVRLQPKGSLPTTSAQTYRGSGVLSPLAPMGLETAIGKLQADSLPSALYTDLQTALTDLQQKPLVFQALSGLNEALLMHWPIQQLPVTAPNPKLPSDIPLTTRVAAGVGSNNTHGVLPTGHFNPIRGGYISSLKLSLVDVYGRKRKIATPASPQTFRCSSRLRFGSTETHQQVYLPPGLTQPARLLFRYLAAGDNSMEMSPVLSPVCGWLIPNHLENSLMIWDQNHQPVGSLYLTESDNVYWQTAPGSSLGATQAAALTGLNTCLAQFVNSIKDKDDPDTERPGFLQAFLNNMNAAAAGIDAAHYRNPSLAMLMGHPLALVQVSLKLELQGKAAVNQSWAALKYEWQHGQPKTSFFVDGRRTNGFEAVKFPVQLGQRQRLLDGLVGYFTSSTGGYNFTNFYGVAAQDTNNVKTPSDILLAAEDRPVTFLAVVDPRAKIHATSGILPTKAIEIPPSQYAAMLAALEMNFPVSAVLGPADQFALPLPVEAGFQWNWVENKDSAWNVKAVNPTMQKGLFSYSPQTINSGWLQLKRSPDNDS